MQFNQILNAKIKNEAEYYKYLDKNYAEDSKYENKLKKLSKEYEKIKKSKSAN